jgi:hypothetical protein
VANVTHDTRFRESALRVLENAWVPAAGCCRPNKRSYPHLWMWDSCFHSIAWSAFADPRAVIEIEAVFAGQLDNGFLPHMRYLRKTTPRGPLPGVSSFTQPPVYARALRAAVDAGLTVPPTLIDKARQALEALWSDRLRDGLLVIVHPWESGADDSPRWDSWVGSTRWRRRRWTRFDKDVLAATVFGDCGQAVRNTLFEVAPAAFNAIAADAAVTIGDLAGDPTWTARGRKLAAALDRLAWRADLGLWSDVAYTGGGDSVSVPTLDGVLPALCTADSERSGIALRQLTDDARFGAEFGPRYVVRDHPVYVADQYWRGPCWPQLNYLCVLAARRCTQPELAHRLSAITVAGCSRARFSEYWNPESGRGLGARPQTWAAVAAALDDEARP